MFLRGINPIWLVADLTGHLLDDSYYMFVLENEIPYIPAEVYHDPDTTANPWSFPINFLANGTLPVDIYWDPGSDANPNVYRIEIRQGDTQSDPLIYLIENYVPGAGGTSPPGDIGFVTDNQITNPQFAIVNFVSPDLPYTLPVTTDSDIEIGPGWVLSLTTNSAGSAIITQVPLNSDDLTINPGNAPYALRLQLTGWTDVKLKQRFNQNGMLWADKIVSSTITARSDDANALISANLIDSMGTPIGQVLSEVAVSGEFEEYTGHDTINSPSNTDIPPDAWIEYQLQLQNNVDIYITSIQLIAGNLDVEPVFEQDSIERQIDHTFHYYEPQLAFKPVPSLLTGWDFTVNPAQFGSTKTMTIGGGSHQPQYIWDQTIGLSKKGNVTVAKSGSALGIAFTNSQPNEAFYIMQYLTDGQAARAKASNLCVNIDGYALVSTAVQARVYLFAAKQGGSIPLLTSGSGAIGNLNADGTFDLTDTTGWQEIPLIDGYSRTKNLKGVNTHDEQDINFIGYDGNSLYGSTTSTQLFCIVATFLVPTTNTFVYFNSISLTPGDIPSRPAQMTAAATLAACQYYYEMSYAGGGVSSPAATAVFEGSISQMMDTYLSGAPNASATTGLATPFGFQFQQQKVSVPTMSIYSTKVGTIDKVTATTNWFNGSFQTQDDDTTLSTHWGNAISKHNAIYYPISNGGFVTVSNAPSTATYGTCGITFNYIADARLGVV